MYKIIAENNTLSIFTTETIYNRVIDGLGSSAEFAEWVVKEDNESKGEFLSRVQYRTEIDLDILFSFPLYGTVLDYHQYNKFEPACPFVFFAYNLNGWLGQNFGLTLRLDHYLKYPFKRRFLNKVDTLLVEFEPIREYVTRRLKGPSVEVFTPVLYREDSKNNNDLAAVKTTRESLVITVPGMIDKTRRDYDTILTALEDLSVTKLADIKFVLLGKPIGKYGEKIIKRADRLSKSGMNLVYFDKWIPTSTFTKHLIESDILVSPLQKTRQIDGFVEEYGRSKGSGAISDAIRYTTPLLLPEWYKIPKNLTPGINSFDGVENLSQTITRLLMNHQMHRELIQGIKQITYKYTKRSQQDRLQTIMNSTL
jgi:hypothetical protein